MTKWKIQNVLYEVLNFGTTGPWPPFNQYSSPYQCGASPSSSVQALVVQCKLFLLHLYHQVILVKLIVQCTTDAHNIHLHKTLAVHYHYD